MTSTHPKFTVDQVAKLPPSFLLRLIKEAKDYLKTSQTMIDVCAEWDQDVSIIDLIPTRFDKLDVSAKTNQGIVLLNLRLLSDGDFFGDYGYLVHEYTHWLQQTLNDKPTKGSNDKSYLDNKYEVEGFQHQVKYIEEQFGEDKAKDYVDNLTDYHDFKGKKKEDKEEELLELVEVDD